IVNIAAVAITPFSPTKLYDLRKLHGRIEKSLNWGEKHTSWTLALCFQSGFNVFKGPPHLEAKVEDIKAQITKKEKLGDSTDELTQKLKSAKEEEGKAFNKVQSKKKDTIYSQKIDAKIIRKQQSLKKIEHKYLKEKERTPEEIEKIKSRM